MKAGVFLIFLRLGCLSFGGPVAHLGYFELEFVRRRKWLSAAEYADLVALCQFLPGPASSQVGFAIGLKRAGMAGAFAAWLGFTLPSAILMIGFALGLAKVGPLEEAGWIAGLKVAAVAVVANAIWSMARTLCPDRARALIALASAALLVALSDASLQVLVIMFGGLVGWILFRKTALASEANNHRETIRQGGWPYLAAFVVLLAGLPTLRLLSGLDEAAFVDAFYRAGSLVFGGGHVLLPLLDAFTVAEGWVDRETFLAGYGAAQALPGPLFAFAGYLGTFITTGPGGITGGLLAIIILFLPSWLLVLGTLPYWDKLRRFRHAQAAMMGANAAVVGLLLAAFYDPIWIAGVTDAPRLAFALIAFAVLRFTALPVWALVATCALGGGLML